MQKSGASEEAVRRLIRLVALVGLGTLAGATIGFAIIQAAQALEISPWRIFDIPFSQVFAGRVGLMLALRLLLIVILGWFVWRLPSPGTGSSRAWWLILVLASLT
jgi:hypothetical protein